MTGLEALHRVRKLLVEGAARPVGGKIAGDDQPLAQQLVAGALDAEGELGIGRDCRPAAAYGKIGVAERGILDALGRTLVIGWLVRQRERRGGAALRRRSGCAVGAAAWAGFAAAGTVPAAVAGLGLACPVVSVCASAEALASTPTATIIAWRFDMCPIFPMRTRPGRALALAIPGRRAARADSQRSAGS